MKSLFMLSLFSSFLGSNIFADSYEQEISQAQAPKKQTLKSSKPAKKKRQMFVFDVEILSGYRQDNLRFDIYSNTSRPSYDKQQSTAYIWQNNLVLGLSICDRGYINAMGGYGLLVNNDAKFTTEWITADTTTVSKTKTHSGYAADWDVMGGGYFDLYRNNIRLAPELGYSWKRLKANGAYAEKFQAPYVGARLDIMLSKKYKVHLVGFYDYYFCISREDLNYSYLYYNDYLYANDFVTGGSIFAYKTGANLTYSPFKHWTFGLKWQMFHEQTKPKTIDISSGLYQGTEKMRWTSQQIQFAVDFRF